MTVGRRCTFLPVGFNLTAKKFQKGNQQSKAHTYHNVLCTLRRVKNFSFRSVFLSSEPWRFIIKNILSTLHPPYVSPRWPTTIGGYQGMGDWARGWTRVGQVGPSHTFDRIQQVERELEERRIIETWDNDDNWPSM